MSPTHWLEDWTHLNALQVCLGPDHGGGYLIIRLQVDAVSHATGQEEIVKLGAASRRHDRLEDAAAHRCPAQRRTK